MIKQNIETNSIVYNGAHQYGGSSHDPNRGYKGPILINVPFEDEIEAYFINLGKRLSLGQIPPSKKLLETILDRACNKNEIPKEVKKIYLIKYNTLIDSVKK